MMQMDIKNLSVKLGGQYRLDDVSLQLYKGELVGLIGPNGSGKSTLLKTLLGLNSIEQGSIILREKNLFTYDNRERGKLLGYLEQHGEIHWPLSVERLVALGRTPYIDNWAKTSAEDQQHIDNALTQTDTLHLRERIATTLSGGEKCRVLLARVLAGRPDILLVDEPTAALDPAHQLMVMNTLRNIVDEGSSAIIAIHDLTLACRYCDRLAMLNNGKLIIIDVPNKVITTERLASVYGIQAALDNDENGKLRISSYALIN